MIWILILIGIIAIIGIAIVNFPKCAPADSRCDSSILGCCKNLECDSVTNMCKVPEETQYDFLSNHSCRINLGARLTNDPNLAEGLSKEEFAKVVMNKCNACRNDPSGEYCYNIPCESFMIFDSDKNPPEAWDKGISYICDSSQKYNEDPISDVYQLKNV
jgi:hypothetical protein